MKVFDPDLMIDCCDLFISSGKKPEFKSGSSQAAKDGEERDPFDDMMDEAEKEKEEEVVTRKKGGLLPENINPTQGKPDGPLQSKNDGRHGYHNRNNQRN